MEITFTLDEIPVITKKVLDEVSNKILLFYGDMGVGKTTLIKEFAKQLGVTDTISSPTYSIVNEYKTNNNKLYHFDFYRITNEEEVLDIGIEEYFYSDHWCFIEWPQKIDSLLPENVTKLLITKSKDETRKLKIMPVR